MSWLDVVVAPSSPSAALPTAAAAPPPASMILTHCNELPARGAEREGRRRRMWRGRAGGRNTNEIQEITCRGYREDDEGKQWGILREETGMRYEMNGNIGM